MRNHVAALLSAVSVVASAVLFHAGAAEVSYTGIVRYSNASVVSFDAAGRLVYVAPTGRVAQGSVYGQDGRMVRAGTLLVRRDTEIPLGNVKLAEAKLEEAQAVLAEKEIAFTRDKDLYEKNAVSQKDFLASQLAFDTARIAVRRAELDLEQAREVLADCSIYAPFDGVVDEVFQSTGASADVATPILKLSAPNPALIEVELPQTLTRQLDLTDQVLVYPVGESEPVSGWFDNGTISSKWIEVYVANPLVPVGTLTEDEQKLPRIENISQVYYAPAKTDSTPWWIVSSALLTGSDGKNFVWKVESDGARPPFRRQVTLRRVEVEALDLEIQVGGYWLKGIAPNPALVAGDLLAASVPSGCADGDRAVYQARRYRFRPGETVRVKIKGEFTSAPEAEESR